VAERLGRFRLAGTMRRLKGLQDLLGDLHDLQVLAALTRDVMAQSPASRRPALESLTTGIDDEIRALHSRFVAERDGVVALFARATDVRRTLISLPPHSGLAATPRARTTPAPATGARTRTREDR
jgi:hypothetical protein